MHIHRGLKMDGMNCFPSTTITTTGGAVGDFLFSRWCPEHGSYYGDKCTQCQWHAHQLFGQLEKLMSPKGKEMNIEQTENGFLVKKNSKTYCFETMDSLIKFIQDSFKKE